MFLTFLILFLNLLRNNVRFLPELDKCAPLNLVALEIYSLSGYAAKQCTLFVQFKHCMSNILIAV